jgi:hypothetical protein
VLGSLSVGTNSAGEWSLTIPGDAGGTTFYIQALIASGGQFLFSNAVQADFQ